MLIITAYTVFTLTIILAGLVAIKLDGWLSMTWSVVFIPLWLNILVLLGFAFFMCPGFMDRKVGMHRQAILMFSYIIGILIFSVLAVMQLDGAIHSTYSIVFIPIWIAQGLHLMSIVCSRTKASLYELANIVLMVTITILLALTLDDIGLTWFAPFVPIWTLFLLWTLASFIHPQYTKEGWTSLS